MIATILGGIGLFLLGMVLLTDGLKVAAGDALRDALSRLTGGPWRALLSGVGTTALVQSSSATVVTTIGFVSAGLLTFPQALGVIFGANLGTTSTGWIVSLLGLKLSIGAFAMPFVGLGAFLRLLTRGRSAALGLALAGFGLIFVGIDVLQRGMADLGTRIDPSAFPGGTLAGRFALVGMGVVMTVVMQSSSAAVATTLTALHTSTITLEQAATLVIGQNVGTTVTAALAAIGASVPARRTALAHILFNVVAGVFAFALLPLFTHLAVETNSLGADPAVALALFHTVFNGLGIVILMPLIGPIVVLLTRAVRERTPMLTRHLDPSVAQVPAVAVEAARRTVMDVTEVLLRLPPLADSMPRARASDVATLDMADLALAETRRFLARVRTLPDSPDLQQRHLSVLHAIDHLDRFIEALREPPGGALEREPQAVASLRSARPALASTVSWLRGEADAAPAATLRDLSQHTAAARRTHRRTLLERTVVEGLDPDDALVRLELMRRLDRLLYHVWRAVAHLSGEVESASEVYSE